MNETFKTCFERLETLSTTELDRSVADLVRVENRNVALVIAHLAEISRRKAELECGYRNLFDYGLRRLGLSEGSIALRLQVANVARRFPQVLASLADGRISLSVAGRLAPHLSGENVETLLSDCAGMTKRAVEEYLVRLSPQAVFPPSIRKRPGVAEGNVPQAEVACAPSSGPAPVASPAPSTPSGLLAPATPQAYNFRFAAGENFKAKLERLAEVLGIENAAKNMVEVLERALDLALERKDPQERLERRREREQRREVAAAGARSADKSRPGAIAASKPSTSRHVPVAVRDRVLERAGHRCQFTGPDGTRCTARTGLEVEHKIPFGVRPRHDEWALEILCRRHNVLRAEQAYGAEHVHRKIEERRLERIFAHTRWGAPQ